MHDGGFGESVCSTCRQKFRPNAILSIVDVRLTPGSGWVLSIIGCVLTRANRTICLVHAAVLKRCLPSGSTVTVEGDSFIWCRGALIRSGWINGQFVRCELANYKLGKTLNYYLRPRDNIHVTLSMGFSSFYPSTTLNCFNLCLPKFTFSIFMCKPSF